ncbi:hypothetical protein [Mesorhizobium sp. M0244]|uniref:hypothetical protein n=1 Tax=Mesorhizobium sp. M0244 TaxID=2956926 RepID=UPI00333B1F74
MTGSQSSASLRFGANCSFDIPAAIKVDPGEGGMCVALDTSGMGLGLAPILLGGGAALVIGLHDDDSVSQ